MRQTVIALAISMGLALQADAAEVLNADPGIVDTIQSQIEAFQVDDFTTAFTFASPSIRRLFGDVDRFGAMVRNGYPMVWRPGEVRFLELREIDGRIWQKVLIRDQLGAVHILDYQMLQLDGGWLINGVQILRAPDVGA